MNNIRQITVNQDIVYTHVVKGGEYRVLFIGAVEIDEKWVEGITYQSLATNEVYTRTSIRFNQRFKMIT